MQDDSSTGPFLLAKPLLVTLVLITALPVVLNLTVRYPNTPSAPPGFYLLTYQEARHGDWVVACLPPWVALEGLARGYLDTGRCRGFTVHATDRGSSEVLKRIAALPGDQVEVTRAGIRVNGQLLPNTTPLSHDSQGRPLRPATTASAIVPPGRVWLYSSYSPRSWDSRYYGPIPLTGIRSTAIPFSDSPEYAN